MKTFTVPSFFSQKEPALLAMVRVRGPHRRSLPCSSTVTTEGLWLFRGFSFSPPPPLDRCEAVLGGVCGSSADLPGPPRRGPRGSHPRRRLSSHTTGQCQRGTMMVATGGPLLGVGDVSNAGDAARGTAAASCFPAALPGRTAAANGPTRVFSGRGISAAGRRTVLAHASSSGTLAGSNASLVRATRCGGSQQQ